MKVKVPQQASSNDDDWEMLDDEDKNGSESSSSAAAASAPPPAERGAELTAALAVPPAAPTTRTEGRRWKIARAALQATTAILPGIGLAALAAGVVLAPTVALAVASAAAAGATNAPPAQAAAAPLPPSSATTTATNDGATLHVPPSATQEKDTNQYPQQEDPPSTSTSQQAQTAANSTGSNSTIIDDENQRRVRRRRFIPPSRPPRHPLPQPGDLVAWVPDSQDHFFTDCRPENPNLIQQGYTLSRYAPRLSRAEGEGAPTYEASCPVPLGVVTLNGKWAYHNGHEGDGKATVCIADLPPRSTSKSQAEAGGGGGGKGKGGRLVIARPAQAENVDEILLRVMQWPVPYEIVGGGSNDTSGQKGAAEAEGDGGGTQAAKVEGANGEGGRGRGTAVIPSMDAATPANARFAAWVTSIAGAHLRTPIDGGPMFHHFLDTGEGTCIHYSGGEVRLDPLYVLLCRDLGPLTMVSQRQATETEVLEALARATTRLGERKYDVIKNNCEHLASWATEERHRSEQVATTSLAVGSVGGLLGGLLLGAATAPLWCLPAVAMSGMCVGGIVTHNVVSKVTAAHHRQEAHMKMSSLRAAANAVAVGRGVSLDEVQVGEGNGIVEVIDLVAEEVEDDEALIRSNSEGGNMRVDAAAMTTSSI